MMTTMISVLGDTNQPNKPTNQQTHQTPESGWNYLVKQQSLSMTDDRVDAVVVEVSCWDAAAGMHGLMKAGAGIILWL